MFDKNLCIYYIYIIYTYIIYIYLPSTSLVCFYIIRGILLNSSRFLTLSFEKHTWEKKKTKNAYLREKLKSLENEMQS